MEAAIGAGLLGFTSGAVIGSAAANAVARPVAVGGSSHCASRDASYDPASGIYLGYDDDRHPCP